MLRLALTGTIAVALTAGIGCGQQQTVNPPQPNAEAEAGGRLPDDPRERATAAQKALFKQLSTRLLQAISDGGPAAAISVCKSDAPQIAKDVGQKYGVTIGRTSFRLRNPGNAPPDWATDLVAKRIGEPHFVDLPDGRLAALLPIRLKPQCMTCHGPQNEIAEKVKTALAGQYPDDQATGFNVDDLRGWFWVEVPARGE